MATTLSVALASCNGARHLGSQLQSILEQSVHPSEIVIADDVSTDGSLKVINDFAKRAPFPVRLTVNEERLGWKRNFARAALQCSGDLIAFCDQDDIWLPAKIECVLESLEKDAWHAVVHANAFMFDSSIELRRSSRPRLRKFSRATALYGGFDGHRLIFRRELLQWLKYQNKFQDPLFPGEIAHDRLVMLAALTVGQVTYLDKPLTLFRRHEAQVTIRGMRRSQGSDYMARALVLEEWCTSIRNVGKELAINDSSVEKMANCLGNLKATHDYRSTLYGAETFSERLKLFGSALLRKSYARKDTGGLGLLSMAKDAACVFVPAVTRG